MARDISTTGLFVRTRVAPRIGTMVQAEVQMTLSRSSRWRMRLEMTGPVVRVESETDPGFAISATTLAVFESANTTGGSDGAERDNEDLGPRSAPTALRY